MSKKISILMSTYNEPLSWIDDSINSIIQQTYSNFEFIIICDNPKNTDLVGFLNQKSTEDDRIKLVFNDKNIGLANSLNKAFKISNGDFIARMDADDISKPNRLEIELKYLEEENLDFVSSNVDIIDENSQCIKQANLIGYEGENLKKVLSVVNVFMHPTFMAKRIVYDQLKGYREFPAAEDYDFVLRAIDAGFKMKHIKDSLLYYRLRQNSMGLGNALVSEKCTKYIQNLHLERIKNISLTDSYDKTNLSEFLKVSDRDKIKYANILYNIKVKNRSSKFKIGFHVIKGILISNFFRTNFKNMLKIQLYRKKYGVR